MLTGFFKMYNKTEETPHYNSLSVNSQKRIYREVKKSHKSSLAGRSKIEFHGLSKTSRNGPRQIQRSPRPPSGCRLSSRDLSQEDGGDGGGTGHHDGAADSVGSTSVLGGAGTARD